jgi:hypothetical protein
MDPSIPTADCSYLSRKDRTHRATAILRPSQFRCQSGWSAERRASGVIGCKAPRKRLRACVTGSRRGGDPPRAPVDAPLPHTGEGKTANLGGQMPREHDDARPISPRHPEVPGRRPGLEGRRPGCRRALGPCILRGRLRRHLRMTDRGFAGTSPRSAGRLDPNPARGLRP